MNPVAQPPGGEYCMPPAMAMQQPQQPNGQQIPQYGEYQQQQQPPPMQYGAGMNMQGGQQYQQPQSGFGQPQQPFWRWWNLRGEQMIDVKLMWSYVLKIDGK